MILHSYGWVHRDIRAGNVLLVDGKPKLIGFEYAIHEDDKGHHHDVRTVSVMCVLSEVSLIHPRVGHSLFHVY